MVKLPAACCFVDFLLHYKGSISLITKGVERHEGTIVIKEYWVQSCLHDRAGGRNETFCKMTVPQ